MRLFLGRIVNCYPPAHRDHPGSQAKLSVKGMELSAIYNACLSKYCAECGRILSGKGLRIYLLEFLESCSEPMVI